MPATRTRLATADTAPGTSEKPCSNSLAARSPAARRSGRASNGSQASMSTSSVFSATASPGSRKTGSALTAKAARRTSSLSLLGLRTRSTTSPIVSRSASRSVTRIVSRAGRASGSGGASATVCTTSGHCACAALAKGGGSDEAIPLRSDSMRTDAARRSTSIEARYEASPLSACVSGLSTTERMPCAVARPSARIWNLPGSGVLPSILISPPRKRACTARSASARSVNSSAPDTLASGGIVLSMRRSLPWNLTAPATVERSSWPSGSASLSCSRAAPLARASRVKSSIRVASGLSLTKRNMSEAGPSPEPSMRSIGSAKSAIAACVAPSATSNTLPDRIWMRMPARSNASVPWNFSIEGQSGAYARVPSTTRPVIANSPSSAER